MVDGPRLGGRKKHCRSQCTSEGYKRGPVATACGEGHIAVGCRPAGMKERQNIDIDKT
jgi:hypothetical protein